MKVLMLRAISPWLMAMRLRTLFIPTIQVITATGVAYATTGSFNMILALGAWCVATLITIGTNLLNDVFDFEKGGDSLKRVGHLKVIAAGLLSKSDVLAAGLLALGAACLLPFLLPVHWAVYLLVFISAICGYCYTGGPCPISYFGLSEIFVFIFYGLACVSTTFYVQTGAINLPIVLTSVQMGLLAILPCALNNLRDIFDDAAYGKNSLAVRFGKQFARWEILGLTVLPFLLNLAWALLGYPTAALTPFLIAPLAFLFIRKVWATEPSPVFNRYFLLSVLIHFSFGLLLLFGFLIHFWF